MDNSQSNPIVKECYNCIQTMNIQLPLESNEIKRPKDLISSSRFKSSELEKTRQQYKEKLTSIESRSNDTSTGSTSIECVEKVDKVTSTEPLSTNAASTKQGNSDDDNSKQSETIKSLTHELNLLKAKYEKKSAELDMKVGEKNKYRNLLHRKKEDKAKLLLARNVTNAIFVRKCQKRYDRYDNLNSDLQLLQTEYNDLERKYKTLKRQLAIKGNTSLMPISNTFATAMKNTAVNMIANTSSASNSTKVPNKKKAPTTVESTPHNPNKRKATTSNTSSPNKKKAATPAVSTSTKKSPCTPTNSNTYSIEDTSTTTYMNLNKNTISSPNNTTPISNTPIKMVPSTHGKYNNIYKFANKNIRSLDPIYTSTPNDMDKVKALRAAQFIFDPDGVLSKKYAEWTKNDDDIQEETDHKHRSKSRTSKDHEFSHRHGKSTKEHESSYHHSKSYKYYKSSYHHSKSYKDHKSSHHSESSKENTSYYQSKSPSPPVKNSRETTTTTNKLRASTNRPSSQISYHSPIHASEVNHDPVIFKGRYEPYHSSQRVLQDLDNNSRKRALNSQETVSCYQEIKN